MKLEDSPALRGVEAKLRRADEHMKAVEEYVALWHDQSAYGFTHQRSADSTLFTVDHSDQE